MNVLVNNNMVQHTSSEIPKEARITSVLDTTTLQLDDIHSEKLKVEEEDLKCVKFRIFKRSESRNEPIFVPIKLTRPSIRKSMMVLDDNFLIPHQLIHQETDGTIIRRILKLSSGNHRDTEGQQSFSMSLCISKNTEEDYHCRCCIELKRLYYKNKLWRSEPNLFFPMKMSFYGNRRYKKPLVRFNVTNFMLKEPGGCEPYTEVDMTSIRHAEKESMATVISNLYLNIENLRSGAQQMQADVRKLKDDFHFENQRTSALLKDTRKFVSDLKDVQYLDDLIHLLEDQLEKIEAKPWPFRIIRNVPEGNLIV